MRVSPIREIDGRLVLPAAPETEDDAARLRDAVSHMVVSSTDTVTVDDELYGPRNPGDTHLVILFTGAGEKRVVLATAYDGQTITIVKNDDASSIVLEPSGDGPTFRGSSSDATVQTSIAERRAFTIVALGDDYDYVGIPQVDGATARRLVLGSTASTTIPSTAQNTAIGYSEEIGARRRTGSSAVGVQVFHRVSRSTFDTASQTLISGGIGAAEVPADCMIVAEADVVAVGSVRYAAKLMGTFQVSSGTITKLFDAAIGPALPAELSTLHFNVTSDAIGVQLVQPSSGPSWTFTTRTKFTVVEDPS